MELKDFGVTPAKAKQFAARNINTPEDLAGFIPKAFKDYSKETGIQPEGSISCILVIPTKVRQSFGKTSVIYADCTVIGTNQPLRITWFNQNYRYNEITKSIGKTMFACGKVTWDIDFRVYKMSGPEVFSDPKDGMRIYPEYQKIPGMSEEYFLGKLNAVLSAGIRPNEELPERIRQQYGVLSTDEACSLLHSPGSMEEANRGLDTILMNDLSYFALSCEYQNRNLSTGSPFNIKSHKLYNRFVESLPFELTEDQVGVIKDLEGIVAANSRLNALIQGDVGCGKTAVAVALMCLFAGSDRNYQCALMAPTKVLAKQHFEDLTSMLAPLGITPVYLGSELKAAEKKDALKKISEGAQFVVGTHSLLGKDVHFKQLVLTITDEEHRFGVSQKAELLEKGMLGVHAVTMSATPIPKSLASVMYGSAVQLENISSMPKGRLPVITGVSKGRERNYKFIATQVRKGHQIYIVCPMIDANEKLEGVASVQQIEAEYSKALVPYGVRIATLTGKDSKEHTEEVLLGFRKHEYDVLIATSVIEVGINVPNSTGIIIESAERFGLAQLHQLRGRVGRGSIQSYCVLCSNKDDESTNERFAAMCRTSNGFEIAEADLKLRGPGDFIGNRQSGENKYISLMLAYPDKYKTAKLIAKDILENEDDCRVLDRVLNMDETV